MQTGATCKSRQIKRINTIKNKRTKRFQIESRKQPQNNGPLGNGPFIDTNNQSLDIR